jgi:sec-independent protein translocase protein TatA
VLALGKGFETSRKAWREMNQPPRKQRTNRKLKSRVLVARNSLLFRRISHRRGGFMLAGPDLLVILGIALLIFGPKKLPELAKGLGKAIRDFKKSVEGDDSTSKELEDKSKTEE